MSHHRPVREPTAEHPITVEPTGRHVTVRVNGWESPWTYGDVIEVVTGAGAAIDALVLPKTQSAAQVQALDLLLTQVEHTAGLPVGRIGLPEDIWLAVRFVLECDYFNGRTIDVDGGLSM